MIAQKDLDDDPNNEQGEQQGNHHLDQTDTSLVIPRCGLHSSVLTIKACWAGSPPGTPLPLHSLDGGTPLADHHGPIPCGKEASVCFQY